MDLLLRIATASTFLQAVISLSLSHNVILSITADFDTNQPSRKSVLRLAPHHI